MELIKIIFFAFGSFFGVENSMIYAEKTNVTIDIEKQIIEVSQENLFTMVRNEQDSIKVTEELYNITNPASKNLQDWREEFKTYTTKRYGIASGPETQQVNATITLRYNSKEQLKDFAIDYVEEDDSYALINIESWNIESTTGELRGNYWYFKDKISFTLSPVATIPEAYKKYRKSLYPYWERVKP